MNMDSLFIWVEQHQIPGDMNMAIIQNYQYWEENKQELMEWCNHYGIKVEGTVLTFYNIESYVLTKMRWS